MFLTVKKAGSGVNDGREIRRVATEFIISFRATTFNPAMQSCDTLVFLVLVLHDTYRVIA